MSTVQLQVSLTASNAFGIAANLTALSNSTQFVSVLLAQAGKGLLSLCSSSVQVNTVLLTKTGEGLVVLLLPCRLQWDAASQQQALPIFTREPWHGGSAGRTTGLKILRILRQTVHINHNTYVHMTSSTWLHCFGACRATMMHTRTCVDSTHHQANS